MSNEERDSQLSAMFDDELPVQECELLARRLARDPELQARWGRYAAIGAAIRGQAGVRLDGRQDGGPSVADRVRGVLDGEQGAAGAAAADLVAEARPGARFARWLLPVAGMGVAASVAALSILWLRDHAPEAVVARVQPPAAASAPAAAPVAPPPASIAAIAPVVVAQVAASSAAAASAPRHRAGERDSYVVPAPAVNGPAVGVPNAQNANFQLPGQGRPALAPPPQ